MAKLIHNRDHFVYSLENLLDDNDWGYMFSYSFQQPGQDEEANEKEFPQIKKERDLLFSNLDNNKNEAIDRLNK